MKNLFLIVLVLLTSTYSFAKELAEFKKEYLKKEQDLWNTFPHRYQPRQACKGCQQSAGISGPIHKLQSYGVSIVDFDDRVFWGTENEARRAYSNDLRWGTKWYCGNSDGIQQIIDDVILDHPFGRLCLKGKRFQAAKDLLEEYQTGLKQF